MATVLGWMPGAWCDPADLDRRFRLFATRVLNAHGCVRFRHWRLDGERALAGARAAVWVWDETLTIEHAAETLAQYRVAVEADGRLREVVDPRFSPTSHVSPQPFLVPLEEPKWHRAQRVAPSWPRRKRVAAGSKHRSPSRIARPPAVDPLPQRVMGCRVDHHNFPPVSTTWWRGLLLTTTVDEAWARVDWYCQRSLIEDYHLSLKTGCRVEQSQLRDRAAVER